MKKSRFNPVQIAGILKSFDQGKSLEEIIRENGISRQTFYQWRKKYGAGKFTVPQNKAAIHNYGGMTNKGKTRLSSTAQFGLTIFWKTK